MAWVRLDDKMPMSSKLRSAGVPAFGLDVLAICWSAHQEKDGFISDEDLEMFGAMYAYPEWKDLADRLVEVGRWRRDGRKKGYAIQGFLDFNPSHADLEAKRKKDRDRKRTALGTTPDSARNPNGTGTEADGNP